MNTKDFVIGGGILTVGAGIIYLLKMGRLASELETVTTVNIFKIGLTSLDLKVDVTLKNPTGGNITVKYPFVKMLYGDTAFGTSEVKNVDFDLPKFSQKQLEPIMVNVSLISLALQAPGLLKTYRDTGKLSFTIKTITTLNNKIPYTKTETVNI